MSTPRLIAVLSALLVAVPTPGRAQQPMSWRQAALSIMVESARMSRTVADGENLLLPRWEVPDWDVRYTAERNFREAAELVLDHHADLPLGLETAVRLNKILTRGLVPAESWGKVGFRDERGPLRFYRWLESDRGRRVATTHPEIFAHMVQRQIGLLDSFPDGNGRLARLMADLALLRAGKAPALYEDRTAYFQSFKLSSREQRRYFEASARRGARELARRMGRGAR